MIALGLIYDVASERLRNIPMPHVPKPPLYDGRLSKGGDGFVWMSEMLLRDLEWWEAAKLKSAETVNQWTDQNKKSAATLAKWIEWRRVFPNEIWSGKRGEARATAALPSREPKLQSWKEWPTGKGGKTSSASEKQKDNQRSEPPEEEDEGYGF